LLLNFNHFLISLSITNHLSKYHPCFLTVIIVLLLLLSLSLIALVSYCVFYRNLLFSYSATKPQVLNKLSVSQIGPIASPAVFQILRSKRIGVMSLTCRGQCHVTSLVT